MHLFTTPNSVHYSNLPVAVEIHEQSGIAAVQQVKRAADLFKARTWVDQQIRFGSRFLVAVERKEHLDWISDDKRIFQSGQLSNYQRDPVVPIYSSVEQGSTGVLLRIICLRE